MGESTPGLTVDEFTARHLNKQEREERAFRSALTVPSSVERCRARWGTVTSDAF